MGGRFSSVLKKFFEFPVLPARARQRKMTSVSVCLKKYRSLRLSERMGSGIGLTAL